MHVCDEFRERITEQIIDRCDLTNNRELQRELLVCNSCSDFYAESRDLIDAISIVDFSIADEQWEAMANRLRAQLIESHAARTRLSWLDRLGISGLRVRPYVPAMAGVAAMLLIAAGVHRIAVPLIEDSKQVMQPTQVIVASPNASLDPVTVDFFEQSELLLRTVMKLQASSAEDMEETRQAADRQLTEFDQRREAASEILPVVNVMDRYEMILRELRNLNKQTAAEDIPDIKNRIEKNGLIASMKAFQPRVSVVETDPGNDQ